MERDKLEDEYDTNDPIIYEKINLNPNDNYESQRIGASPKANKG